MSGKRKASSPTKESTVESIVDQIQTLESVEELNKVMEAVKERLKSQPILIEALPKSLSELNGKFEVFDKGVSYEYGEFRGTFHGIMPDYIHTYLLRWDDGEELQIIYGNQAGLMHAGTTKFEVQAVRIGPMVVEESFPKRSRLPSGVSDFGDLFQILKKHGIGTKESVADFVSWIVGELLDNCSNNYLIYAVRENLFDDYYEDEENEDDVKEVVVENGEGK